MKCGIHDDKGRFVDASDPVFGLKLRGTRRKPEPAPANTLKRKMLFAPAVTAGTLITFFFHRGSE